MLNASSKVPSSTPKATWAPPAALAIAFLSFLVLPTISQLILLIMPQLFGLSADEAHRWLSGSATAMFLYVLLSDVLTIGILYGFVRHKGAQLREVVALKRPRWRDAGYVIAGTLVYFVLFIILLTLIDQFFSIDTDKEQALGFDKDIAGIGLLIAFVTLVILPPITEEIVFRGFFYGTLRANKISMLWSTLVTSLIFGSLHLFGGTDGQLLWIAMLDTFALSLVLCYAREKTGSLWSSMGIHALKNGFVFVNLFIIGSI